MLVETPYIMNLFIATANIYNNHRINTNFRIVFLSVTSTICLTPITHIMSKQNNSCLLPCFVNLQLSFELYTVFATTNYHRTACLPMNYEFFSALPLQSIPILPSLCLT